jgi:hypothetical protein
LVAAKERVVAAERKMAHLVGRVVAAEAPLTVQLALADLGHLDRVTTALTAPVQLPEAALVAAAVVMAHPQLT